MLILKKILITFLTLFVPITLLLAQSKRDITDIKPFKKINLASGVNLILSASNKTSITLEGERPVISKVICSFNDSVLNIYTTKFNYRLSKHINVYINYDTTMCLSSINTTSGNRIRCESPFNCNRLELNVRNGSDVFFNVEADAVKIKATSGSKVQLVGTAKTADFFAENSCEILAYKLFCNQLSATATIASQMQVYATESIVVWATYDSEVFYKGDPPAPQISVSNGSRVIAK